ncbi:hypothetical protein ACFW2X_06840 [Streptomyces antibioticus]|uniref:hypothetical protein n=1 Tax=Streptomyces antibioticus TaxID=1890 RepID=UPI003674089A
MAGQGPQKYPGASTAYFYQNRYGGDLMEVNVVVLHTTEGTSLPDYGGGASAPNLTAVPDFAARKLKWYQHFDFDRSSRALVNLAGGVETNTLNVCQVELVGTCDPGTHKKWGSAPHIYWPEAPDWALAEVAAFLRWANAEHGVPLAGPAKWPAYPGSYGSGGGQRMTFAQWNQFRGVCGHMHVPENTHGDPGAIDFTRLIALAKGTDIEEDPMAGFTAQEIHDAVWRIDDIAAPKDAADIATNPTWQPQSILRDIQARVRANTVEQAAQTAALAALAKLAGSGVDTAAVVSAVQSAIADAVVEVSVDVTGPAKGV